MLLDDVRSAIVADIANIANIGKVYDYERAVIQESDFKAAFVDDKTSTLRGWTVSRRTTPAKDLGVGAVERMFTFIIRGWFGLKDADATERTFQDLIENIFSAFVADRDLSKGYALANIAPASLQILCDPLQVGNVTQGLLFAYMCHYCELTLAVHVCPAS